jgi:photosystem II stability/assembly factor-like uncharacterized protein
MSISQQALKQINPWESLGPVSPGGTVFGLAISPVAEVPRYWAATGCGVFVSEDAGAHWVQNLTGLSTPLLSTLAVAHNGALFAGALSGDLFVSFDYGRTWEASLVPAEKKATVTFILPSPRFRQDGTTFAATDGGGLLVSRNSGKRWEDSSFGLGDENVLALACAPDWSRRETMFAATMEGVAISVNGGRAWRQTSLALDEDIVDVLAVSPTFDQDHIVYAGTENGSLYESTDGGRTWELLQETIGEGPLNCLWLAPDLSESGKMVAGVGNRIYVTKDGGVSWQLAKEMPNAVLTLAGDDQVVLAGMHDAGICKSTDGGFTWANASEGLDARGFARLVAHDEMMYVLGPQEGLWVSADQGATWKPLPALVPYYPLTAFARDDRGTLLVASQEGGILRSMDGGQQWDTVSDQVGVQAMAMLPGTKSGLAGIGNGALLKTQDGGSTWEPAGIPCQRQEILSIVVSPNFEQDHTILMGTAIPATSTQQGRVALWRSTNGGETWKQVTTQVTQARWIDISLPVGVIEGAPEQAILATGPYCLRPLRKAKDVWISTRVDPNGANTLGVVALGQVDEGGQIYAATGNGVYRSIDGGRTWQPFGEGLRGSSFIGIAMVCAEGDAEKAVLYALSLGGALWKRELG